MKEKNWKNRISSKLNVFPLQMTLTKIKKTRCRLGKYIHKPHMGHRNQTIRKKSQNSKYLKKISYEMGKNMKRYFTEEDIWMTNKHMKRYGQH